jgi:hypothetical protein
MSGGAAKKHAPALNSHDALLVFTMLIWVVDEDYRDRYVNGKLNRRRLAGDLRRRSARPTRRSVASTYVAEQSFDDSANGRESTDS